MNEIKINVKPLSVNEAWKGRRFKTQKYKDYESELLFTLPKIKIPNSPLSVHYEFGISRGADIDNPVKPIQDVLQKRYMFNDNDIFYSSQRKIVVRKGHEYVKFKIAEDKVGKKENMVLVDDIINTDINLSFITQIELRPKESKYIITSLKNDELYSKEYFFNNSESIKFCFFEGD